jgi:hypothetical protein
MKDHVFRHLACSLLVLISAGAATSAFARAPDRSIPVVGEFSNIRYTEEHAYGYAVELWRDGGSIIGLFLAAEGLQGDTPAGILKDVKFDSRTGALSFTAKLSVGVGVLSDGRQEPSRDLFEFSGTLTPTALNGTLTRSDQRHPLRPASRERVELKIRPQEIMHAAGTYAGWKRQTDEILKRRGPRW